MTCRCGTSSRARSSRAGGFGIEMIHMSHSIPDACAVAIHTDLGPILLTGDYKFDQTPVDGRPGRLRPARRARRRGPALPLRGLDQRRPPRRRHLGVERRAGPAGDVLALPTGRIIVTCFASNVHRVQQVVDAADALGRKVALVGSSMRKNFNIASNLGIANAPDGLLIQPREIEDYPGRGGGRDLDRQPGRAALGAAADGPRRAPRRRSSTPATRSSSRRLRCPATSDR